MDNINEYNENMSGEQHSVADVADSVKQGAGAIKEKVSRQAVGLKERVEGQASSVGNQLAQRIDSARGKASTGLRSTSQRINNLAIYMEEHSARDISNEAVRTSKELVRKYPGRSLLVGLVVGMLAGRMFAGLGGRPVHRHDY